MTPNGKIARLPHTIREQLNRRLQNGEPGKKLVAWLNTLPESRRMLAADFGGRPINEPNLSAWKSGGYLLWLLEQETLAQTRQMPQAARELTAAADGQLTGNLSTVLAVRYAVALAGWDGKVTFKFQRNLRMLRHLCQSVVQLRRGDHASARLDLAQKRLDWMRQKNLRKPHEKSPKLRQLR